MLRARFRPSKGKVARMSHRAVFKEAPIAINQTNVLNSSETQQRDQALLKMRMSLRTEEYRRRAAVCAKKALCTFEEEPCRTFAELAEHWRALAERVEHLERHH
jgi:hypothetical protein